MIYPFLILAEFLALAVQEYIPALPYGARIFLLPLVFFYAALAVPPAVLCGTRWWPPRWSMETLKSPLAGR